MCYDYIHLINATFSCYYITQALCDRHIFFINLCHILYSLSGCNIFGWFYFLSVVFSLVDRVVNQNSALMCITIRSAWVNEPYSRANSIESKQFLPISTLGMERKQLLLHHFTLMSPFFRFHFFFVLFIFFTGFRQLSIFNVAKSFHWISRLRMLDHLLLSKVQFFVSRSKKVIDWWICMLKWNRSVIRC